MNYICTMTTIETIKNKYELIKNDLNEYTRRKWCAIEADAIGYGGIALVSLATGVVRSTISIGKKELKENPKAFETNKRMRRVGGGRKSLEDKTPDIIIALSSLVDPETRGDPESPLRWTTKSVRNLAKALNEKGFTISYNKVRTLLIQQGFSLKAKKKTNEGKSHKDRDEQFQYINSQTIEFQSQGEPVVSVDAKKKELIGAFKNGGKEYQPQKSPEEVNVYGFPSLADGRATPYGIYDITQNLGWVNVGISKDTAAFAVNSLRNWWSGMGKILYPQGKKLLIHADSGGSNGRRNRMWKAELQKFANETGLEITVSHFPPGTSKWNKIEHRLFSQITKNWRGRKLESFQTIVNLIGSTSTTTGLKVTAKLDDKEYEGGLKVSDDEFSAIMIQKHDFHGDDWNYTIVSNNDKSN